MPRVGNPGNRRRHFIKEWRQYRGLTQEQLAELLDTTKANISRIENLRQGYTQDMLEMCAFALRTDPASLIIRNPIEQDSFWFLWDQARPSQRKEIMRAIRMILNSG